VELLSHATTTLFGSASTIYRTVIRDLTARKAAEAALEASKNRFRALVEESAEGIWILEPTANIRYSSPAVEKVLGFQPLDVAGKSVFEFVRADEAEKTRKVFFAVASSTRGTTVQSLNR